MGRVPDAGSSIEETMANLVPISMFDAKPAGIQLG